MEYILSVVIIILLINQNNIFKSKIKTLSDSIQKLNNKLDALSSKEDLQNEQTSQFSSEKNKVISEITPIKKEEDKLKETSSIASNKDTTSVINNSTPKKHPQSNKLTSPSEEHYKTPKKTIKPSKPSLWKRFKDKNPDLEKFVGENLINKLGVLILVLGISYFVKYAIDKDWINEPARVGIGILAGSFVLGIAHKLRKKYSSFSSVLVSGAIAIFYFTIAIAFHEYQLFNQTIAFVIMVLITMFSCFLSLSYNRIELAILSLIGGFAVPFMLSTGSGNYQVLFTYITILDIGILVIAYFKKWNLVNTLAFVFTTLLFTSWLIKTIGLDGQTHYQGAFFFAFLFYVLFVLTNIINNLRTKGNFTKTQLSLLAVNSFVFYGVGMFILSNYHPELKGLFTTGLALLNLIYAWFLYKKFGLDKTAVYLLIGLTLTFITLAIPIQFKGNYITLFWAIEAVLLMWLAQKSQIKSYRFASVIVHLLMLVSLIMDWKGYLPNDTKDYFLQIGLNPIFITGIVSSISLFAIRYLLRSEKLSIQMLNLRFNTISYRKIISILAVILIYIVGLLEISYQSFEIYKETVSTFYPPIVYHLIFTAILCLILYKNKTLFSYKVLNIISIVNILLYTFFFYLIPFEELKDSVISGKPVNIAYLLHFVSLILIIYFGFLLYKTNKKKRVFDVFNKKEALWIVAGIIIFISSSELLLEGLKISKPEITNEQVNELLNGSSRELDYYEKYSLGKRNIEKIKFKIIKTALPVLWGILSFLFLILGIKKQIKTLRIIALTLLGITIIKLFAYDISNVSETGKIIAFILLGVLILIISFVYQKIKVLVIDDNNESENNIKTSVTDEDIN